MTRFAPIFCAVASLSSAAWAATAVPRVRSVNLGDTELDLLSHLLSTSYEKTSGAAVTAGIESADEVIEALAYGLGPHGAPPILLRVQRRDPFGVVLARAELRIDRLADASIAIDRITRALVHKVPIEATAEAPAEVGKTDRILGLKLLFAAPLALGITFNALGGLMFDARFERETYFYEVGLGIVVPGPSSGPNSAGYGGVVAELGASKFLTAGNTALYAGAGLLPRLIFSGDLLDSPLNLAPYGQLGLMLDRSSTMRLYADVRIAQSVLPIRVMARGFYPTELTGQIGIGW